MARDGRRGEKVRGDVGESESGPSAQELITSARVDDEGEKEGWVGRR